MRPLKSAPVLAFVLSASLLPSGRALAEDTKGKWQFGFGLSYFSTTDYIRSNSDLALASDVVGDNGLPGVGYTDERPDINIMNQASIRDDFQLDFRASYGLTRWLALEAGASYMNSPVGNIEYYTLDNHQGINGQTPTLVPSCGPDPTDPSGCWSWTAQLPDTIKTNNLMPVGTITEIPINLSGLIRFRPESPLDPYIGLGFGYIIADLQTGDEFNRKADSIADPNFRVAIGDEGEFNDNRCRREGYPYDPVTKTGVGCTDFHPDPLEANVKNTWEWHAVGGVDYYMTDRFSVYVDARYVWSAGAVDIRTDHAHQVRYAINDFGQLLLTVRGKAQTVGSGPFDPNAPPSYDPNNPSTWFLWEDIGVPENQHFHELCPACQNDGYLETEDKNMSGSLDTACDAEHPFCEDEGVLYKLLPGSRDVDEALKIDCPACAHNWNAGDPSTPLDDVGFDTEDANHNGFLDRFLVYGYDLCTTDRARGNDRCQENHRLLGTPLPDNNDSVTYIFPEGCPQNEQQLSPFPALTETGCPPFPPVQEDPVTHILKRQSVGNTGADNASDTLLIQGGRIRLGGFSLGVGFKFTF